jgi:hypothetical protein
MKSVIVLCLQMVLLFAPCVSETIENAAAAKLLPIDWLHIQKCGSTFGNTLLRWACFPNMTSGIITPGGGELSSKFTAECAHQFIVHQQPRRNWPIGDHFTLEPRSNGGDNITRLQHVVTFLREAVDRTISHAFYYRESQMITGLDEANKMGGGEDKIIARYENILLEEGNRNAHGQPSTPNYQTYNLMGTSNTTGFDACERLSHIGFVGITRLWNSSICSFYHTFGRLEALPFELMNVRPSTVGDIFHKYPLLRSVFQNETSWDDMHLYDCAVRQFLNSVWGTPCTLILIAELQNLETNDRDRVVIERIIRRKAN